METPSQKVFLQQECFQRTAENIPLPPLWGEKKEGENVCFSLFFFLTAAGGAVCFFSLQVVNTVINFSSGDDRRSISTKTHPTANPLGDGQGQRVQTTASKISRGSMV